MKFIKWIGIVLFSLIILFFIIPIFLPSNYHIERSTSVKKPATIVFQAATNMKLREQWDPWVEMDPQAKINITVTPEVIGSGYSWDGEVIGQGQIIIQEFIPDELIKSKIKFIAPREMEADIIWTFKQNNELTEITWAFEGELSYLNRWGILFMEKSLGSSFEKGLSNFKSVVEKIPDTTGRTGEILETTFNGIKAISITKKCSMQKLTSSMYEMFTALMGYLQENNRTVYNSPFSIYHPCEEEGYTLLECALPVEKEIKGRGNIKYIELSKTKAIMASHFGHFHTSKTTYEAIEKYIANKNLTITGMPWEMYMTDPTKEFDQSKWETHIYFPIE